MAGSPEAAEEAEQGPEPGPEPGLEPPAGGAVRRGKRAAPGAAAPQPAKLSRAELYKPPTSEELTQLKETEDLFHSSLLRLQIEELLKEVTLKEKKKKKIDAFLHEINSLLSTIPETPETELTDQAWLSQDVKVPFLQVPFNVKGRFRFVPPAELKVVGSYLLGTCVRPEINVDIAVTMPREIFQDKDNLNQRYHRKRALYLSHIAQHFSKEKLFGSVKFAYMNSNHLKPILLLRPQGKDEKIVTVRLHACPDSDLFKPSRFYPSKNNVRTAWFMEQSAPKEGATEPPTPHYNNSILCDTVMLPHLHFLSNAATDFPGMKDGLALLKVWLNQRQLSKGLGCFSGFLVSMLVAYLLMKRKIVKMMSGYQVLRSTLQFLATTDLSVTGISLAKDADPSLPALDDFHQAFEVVFVDPSGLVNLCADMTASKYHQVQFEAKRSMEILDDRMVDGFQVLLMTPKPMLRTFDHVFHLKHVSKLQGTCKKMQLLNELMDRGGNYVAAALPFVVSLLARGLSQRAQLVAHSLPQIPEWPIDAEPPKHKDVGPLTFGLLFVPEFAASALEKGPQADHPKALEFRTFWGEKSELRRFQDGSICEAVVWEASTVSQKRLIPEQIIRHLLKLHADIPESSICYTGALLESVIRIGKEAGGTGEEALVSVVCSYDDLSRKLWNLKELPLTVTAVQGVHPALRYTDVFPPIPVKPIYSFHNRSKHLLLPSEEKPCPAYITPLKIICHMEGSGQWPQDKGAIKRIKAAFHLQLAELLRQQHQLVCRPAVTHTDVYKDGYVFRLQVAYHREPLILKEVVTPEGMLKYQDTEESRQLELETLHLPYLTSSLHGLQQQHPVFGSTSRLAKRWISAQLLSDSISEECVDLLVAFLFLHPAPFTPPSSPQVGFLRFLNLLTTFDWKNNPLIVNLNTGLTESDCTEIKNKFVAARARLPVMFLATPKDQWSSMWTRERPSAQILQRLVLLASESLRALEEQLMDPLRDQDVKMVFRPPLDLYDVLIHLNPNQIPRLLESVDRPVKSVSRGVVKNSSATNILFPVVEYDPVQLYLQELRNAFDDLALFFYDKHGGEVIAVLWKPLSFQPQPFKVSSMRGRKVTTLNNELVCVPNVEAILEDFEILGEGLVKSVEARTEKWTI
ncbi:nucleolar protein 6 isoform X2 [Onychostruthus taczanowskii]|uniref:nucleolar protein 6 isoform X2 n=1 Tax=Onychostruthus taczanowskii TaxID=356909 RepID=UPI001B8062F7|nr:nucleolar protein 6 isoform X2 [Onychostruthus taczanowskii]